LQALQHKVAVVGARKKKANQLKRQANKKIEKQTRRLLQKTQAAKVAIATPDEPVQ
jgi:hypothetical protein